MDDEIFEKISIYDDMYVDQEVAQDDEENDRTSTNRLPTSETNVNSNSNY